MEKLSALLASLPTLTLIATFMATIEVSKYAIKIWRGSKAKQDRMIAIFAVVAVLAIGYAALDFALLLSTLGD